jgi:CRISPR system Cascade subunit CasA
MTELDKPKISYNLWFEPWIDLEKADGAIDRQGIAGALRHAQDYHAIYSSSPLEVVGIHRLLVAILQDILRPASSKDLLRIWQAGCFASESIDQFGAEFIDRFDLFSSDRPFYQSGDLSLNPDKSTPIKPVTYLAQDFPCATSVNHYHHILDQQQHFCPACCARGLVVIPCFASSGGAGIKPSINGVPPLYVLPGGGSLFASLAASLILPAFQPIVRDLENDRPWWRGVPEIEKSGEKLSVGYLESLTFPARRVRLYPVAGEKGCTRCGATASVSVAKMTFEMGISRPKDAAPWRDPFAAYYLRENDKPLPLRPIAGKDTWREFSSLFLSVPPEPNTKSKRTPLRPALVEQLAGMDEIGLGSNLGSLSFRCIGMRTDMKAKIFEWVDSGFNVPLSLLQSSDAGLDVEDALRFSDDCEKTLSEMFKKYLNNNRKKGERYTHARLAMQSAYWASLAEPFRLFIADLGEINVVPHDRQRVQSAERLSKWYHQSINSARLELENALEMVGDDGHALRLRFECLEEFNKLIFIKLKKKEGGSTV